MRIKHLVISSMLVFLSAGSLYAASPVVITDNLTSLEFGKNMEYLKDDSGKYTIDDVISESREWTRAEKENFNFGFNPPAYWFRFTVDNRRISSGGWYMEINYPMIDYIDLYSPNGDGTFSVFNTGDRFLFKQRDIIDRNFVFPQSRSWHSHITCSSRPQALNFKPLMWGKGIHRAETRVSGFWMYFELMFVMTIYNLFLFISVRDYIHIYSLIVTFILSVDPNGLRSSTANQVWWANNCLPFFMLNCVVTAGLFIVRYVETRKLRPYTHRFIVFGIMLPLFLMSLVAFTGNYALSIKLATAGTGIGAVMITVVGVILFLGRSREARFCIFSFSALVIGVVLYVLKSFGVLEPSFLTNWSVQIGSSLVILIFSFGLADKINLMKKDLQKFNAGLEKNEREARERNEFLENTVKTITGMSRDLFEISRELSVIGNSFGSLSTEQAATSEEMSAAFEELTSSNERIYDATVNQKNESLKTKDYRRFSSARRRTSPG